MNQAVYCALLITFLIGDSGATECLIEPNQTIDLASPVTGLLDQVLVKRGDLVSKGQVLAMLNSRAEQAAADLAHLKSVQIGPTRMAESKVEFSKKKFGRRRDMAAERLMAVQDRDDAEAELKQGEAEVLVAQENRQIAKVEFRQQTALVSLRTIRSPVNGVVVDQSAYPGEVMDPGGSKSTIIKVAQLDPLRVHAFLPKEAFGKIAVGTNVQVVPEIPSDRKYTAKVRSVDRLIDAASGTFVVLLEMPNSKLEIPAGVKCKAHFAEIERATPAAPVAAPPSKKLSNSL